MRTTASVCSIDLDSLLKLIWLVSFLTVINADVILDYYDDLHLHFLIPF